MIRGTGPLTLQQSSAPAWPLVVYFHHVGASLNHYTNLSLDAFQTGLDLLLESFNAVSLGELMDNDGWLDPPAHPAVLITFDDGYADLLDGAVQVLRANDVRATFFVCTDLLGRRSADPTENYLSWAEVEGLVADGHTIASHGCTHRVLTNLSAEEADHEVSASLGMLHSRLAIAHPVYAYPYGVVRPIPERVAGFDASVAAFGTVKSPPAPWAVAPTEIRRVYLPTGQEDLWPGLVKTWRDNWESHG